MANESFLWGLPSHCEEHPDLLELQWRDCTLRKHRPSVDSLGFDIWVPITHPFGRYSETGSYSTHAPQVAAMRLVFAFAFPLNHTRFTHIFQTNYFQR